MRVLHAERHINEDLLGLEITGRSAAVERSEIVINDVTLTPEVAVSVDLGVTWGHPRSISEGK